MKKFGIRLPILCALILLVGVTALAAVTGNISPMRDKDASVTVDPPTAENPAFRITRENAKDGKEYLLVIRKDEADDPTADTASLFYMGIEKAANGVVTFSNAYPKDMDSGTYHVYMSDYGANKLQKVATFDVEGALNTNGTKLGDVDGKDGITMDDALAIMRHVAKVPGCDLSDKINVADVDGKNGITMDDALAIMRHIAKVPGCAIS